MNKVYTFISAIGKPFANFIIHLGAIINVFISILYSFVYVFKNPYLVIKEIYYCGVKSLIIISCSGFFVGMVLALQGYNTLSKFGSVSMVGSLVAISLLRELGPVLTAILFAARAGSGITAEIGLMKATEQLEAMNVMAVSPIKRVLAPKFLGGVISTPLLCGTFNVSGIYGGYVVAVIILKLDEGSFWSQMISNIDFHYDVLNGIIKSIVFAIVINLISVYQGYISKPTPEGVSNATTQTVVNSAIIIFALDYILTALMFK